MRYNEKNDFTDEWVSFADPFSIFFFSHLGQQHLLKALKLERENRPWLFPPL